MGCSPPGSSVHGDSPGKNTGMGPPPGDLPHPGIEPMSLMSPTLAGEFYITRTTWKALGHFSDPRHMFVPLYADEQRT